MLHRSIATAAAALALAQSADAQAWGTTGAWQQVVATTPQTGPGGQYLPRPINVAGNVIWWGNNSATNNGAIWSFDAFRSSWSQWADLGPAQQVQQPFITALGGLLVIMDEPTPTTFYTIDTASASSTSTYTTFTAGITPLNKGFVSRYGQRLIDWGGILYSFGGFEDLSATQGLNAGVQHNDLWAIDMLAIATGSPNTNWIQVMADGVAGMPWARVGASFTAFNVAAVMYGGAFSSNAANQNPYSQCLPNNNIGPITPGSGCILLQEVWLFLPGNSPPAPNSVAPTQWVGLQTSGFNGGPVPGGRMQHSAGYMGDQLYVYGGITYAGVSTDLWALNLITASWVQVQQTSPWPTRGGGFQSTGLVLGRSFYIWQTPTFPGDQGALWRWEPSSAWSPPSNGVTFNNETTAAVSAGFALAILLGIANLAFVIILWRRGGGGFKSVTPAAMGNVYEGLPQ